MARSAQIQIQNLTNLNRAIRKAKDKDLRRELKSVYRDGSKLVQADAKKYAPKRKRLFQKSIRVHVSDNGARVFIDGAKVPYAARVHWAKNRKAYPVVWVAAMKNSDEIFANTTKRMKNLLSNFKGIK